MRSELDLEALVDAWRGPLVGLLLARGADRARAEELAQDVFAEAWLSRAAFRGDPADERSVGAWLAGIARNLHRASARSSRTLVALDAAHEVAEEEGEPHSVEGDEAQALRDALLRLPPQEREVVHAYYLEETSAARVALLLGLTERAVEGRLRRARARLAGWLAPALRAGREPS